MADFSLSELQSAAAWADQHVRNVHPADARLGSWTGPGAAAQYPKFALRRLASNGIGDRAIVTCETCDAGRVRNENHADITDYDCW